MKHPQHSCDTPHACTTLMTITTALFLLIGAGLAHGIEEVLPDLVLHRPNADYFLALNANFSTDGKRVVVGHAYTEEPPNPTESTKVGYVINDAEDGRVLSRAQSSVMVAGFRVVSFSPDGKTVLAGEWGMYGGDTILFNAETSEEIWRKKAQPPTNTYPDPRAPPPTRYHTGVGFSLEGDRVFSVVDGLATIRDAKTGEEILNSVYAWYGVSAAFLPGGDRFFVSLQHPTIYDLVTGEILRQYEESDARISTDARTILLFARDETARDFCKLHSLRTGELQRQTPCSVLKGGPPMLTPDTNRIYYRDEKWYSRSATLADLTHAEIVPLRRFLLPEDEPSTIQVMRYAPDGSKFLLQTRNATYLYDIRDLTSTVKDAEAYRN